jgi:hypothetical protein
MRQVHAAALMILRRRQHAADQVPLHLHEAALPVEVAPLEREQLARAHAGPQPTQQPRIPLREPLPSDGDDVCGLVARERIDDRLGIVGAPQIPAQAQRRIRGQQLVFDRLRQDRAQRPRDPADGRRLQSLRTARRDELAAVGTAQRANLTRSERRQDVQREMAVVEIHRARLQRDSGSLQPVIDIRPQRGRRFGRCQLQIVPCEALADA